MKAIVKSEGISPIEYFNKNEKDIIKKLEDQGLSLTNYNVREFLYKSVRKANLDIFNVFSEYFI